ncbi:cyclase family protein [Sediminicoccus sp. BL-A-41-H5]|uniref:cyclase family protein n=1 Tax=Sediminicoccus sp. BL-A-41-H5 TaxID=3421106 RepID=UPI003D6648CC
MQRIGARLGRRGILAAMALAAAAPAANALAQQPARASRVVEMTHVLAPDFPTFGGDPAIQVERVMNIARDGYNLNRITHGEHVGTHFDAPLHFSAQGADAAALPAASLVCPLVVLDVRAKAAAHADYAATPEDVAAHERAHGRIPAGACVALNSGWAAHVATPRFRNAQPGGALAFPGFRPDVAPLLLERGVAGVAVDSLSLDHGGSRDFAFHVAWLGAGRWGIECVAGLAELPPTGATLVGGLPRIAGGTGGPARVLALL